jgi:diacylglycerol O-acyltransferase
LRFRVLAPVSVRREDQRGALGNQVSAWTVDLPIAERDPKARVESIRK